MGVIIINESGGILWDILPGMTGRTGLKLIELNPENKKPQSLNDRVHDLSPPSDSAPEGMSFEDNHNIENTHRTSLGCRSEATIALVEGDGDMFIGLRIEIFPVPLEQELLDLWT